MTESTASDTDRPAAALPDPSDSESVDPAPVDPAPVNPDSVDAPSVDAPSVDAPSVDAEPVVVHPTDPDPAELEATEVREASDAEGPRDSSGDGDPDGATPAVDGDAAEQAPGSEDDVEDHLESGDAEALARLEQEGDIAADYLEELLDIADLDGDLDMDVEGDRAAVSIVGGDVRDLIGRDGEVLEALQELTRLAVYRETGERSRLMLDVGGFRADRRARLEKLAAETVAEVRSTQERKALDPMSPFERKVVHDAVAAAGLVSASEGVEPRRYVVVLPH